MRNGRCDKCGGEVRQLTNGVYQSGSTGVMVNDGSMVRAPIPYETFLCTACGYWENYLTDVERLRRAAAGHGGWAPPA